MADPTPSVDGVSTVTAPVIETPAAKPTEPKAPPAMKAAVLAALSVPYAIYIFWCLFLLSSFPVLGESQTMILIGNVSMLLGIVILLGIGALGFMRISSSKALPNAKLTAMIKLGAFVIPGVLLSAVTPLYISGEPALTINIVSPTSSDQFVAPLAINFTVKPAVDELQKRGFKPIQYNWDINGDKKPDQQTLTPELTANFDRQGIYTVSVSMKGADGTTKSASKRFIILRSVFSVAPTPPVVERPVVFSLSNLYPKTEDVTSVAWDFDGDGKIDEPAGGIQTSYTYLKTGSYNVTAVAILANKTQVQYARTITVTDPVPLPFPVTIKTDPEKLIGNQQFAALFFIETQEPVYSVNWDFGDGDKADGVRTTHTFQRKGSFAVVAKVRSQSGAVAELSTVVKIVDPLVLDDLHFTGPNDVRGNTVTGEAPLTLDLTPETQKQFIQFSWEAPLATEIGSTDTHLQAIYRKSGTYTVTLVAQDLEDHVLRVPITVTVTDPSPLVSFTMTPDAGLAPLDVTFDASDSSIPGEEITGFIWHFGDGTPDQIGGAIVKHTFTSANTYNVTLTAKTTTGLSQSAEKTLIVRSPGLQARILPSRLNVSTGDKIEFKGDSSVGAITDWVWDFGDDFSNSGPIVDHIFTTPGKYTVTLTVNDAAGLKASSTVLITVQ